MRLVSFTLLGLVAACAAPVTVAPQDQQSAAFREATRDQLCGSYMSGASPLDHMMIEAELVIRGVETCGGGANLGRSTAAYAGIPRYARTPEAAPVQDRNCSDFSSGAVAQRFFLASGGPTRDPHGLDADGDGLACEWGTEVKRIADRRPPAAPRVASTPRKTASATCHVGPRGGTYTITSGGYKDYDGC